MAFHVLDEAKRCLGCKTPLCQQGCPIHTNIPEVIRLLKDSKLDEAGWMLFENNPLTTVCSIVCNHEKQCEGHCIRNRMPSHDPVHFSVNRELCLHHLCQQDGGRSRPQKRHEGRCGRLWSGRSDHRRAAGTVGL